MTVKMNSFAESLNETTKLLTQRNTIGTEKRSIEPTDDEKQPLILTTNSKASCGECVRARYVLVFLGFINFVNSYTVRVNLNVAIVAMVNYTEIHHDQPLITECPNSEGVFNFNSTIEKFIWDEYTQGIILGCFYFGYLITNLFGGTLAKRFGDKRVFGLEILLSSVLTLLTPLSLQLPIGVFIAKRIVEGLGQLARWIPKSELSLASTIVYNGAQIGTVVTMPLTGVLSNSDFLGGWPSSFYLFGFYGSALCLSAVNLANCDHVLAVTILALSMGFNGFIFPGFFVVGVDMTPNYAGVLMGLTNRISQLNGFIVPYVVGSLTQGQQTLQQWKKVFPIGAAIYTFCGTFFVIFGSAELQPWNDIGSSKTEEPACPMSVVSSNTPEKRTSAKKNNS
ncbi:putative inorganic phosphate cotransporter [Tachypleus tridentatus]|uniref:putative inorganic phosphate cotransporter n=1 Tax=Tachypleus tridentatus TaxID=6853 RepID=UPI003FD437BE